MSTSQFDRARDGAPVPQKSIGNNARITNSAVSVAAVTPSDTVALAYDCIGLWVGVTGNVAVTMQDGSKATFTAVPSGTLLPVSPAFVNATNTTATGIVALF